MKEKKILQVLKNKNKNILPIWLMRQAGRYLPEYREIRANHKNFLDLCYSPEMAATVTLQPIERFGFDAAIIFSDILVIPHALGVKVEFLQNEGPKLEVIKDSKELANLKLDNITSFLEPVYEALKITKSKLPSETTLIGFAGSPWTIAAYMLQGGSSKDFSNAKIEAFKNSDLFNKLIEILVESISIHACNQIEAGAEVIQLFDSWSGMLGRDLFFRAVIEPTKKIVQNIKVKYPEVPIIGFPRKSGIFYKDYIEQTGVDAVSIDSDLPIDFITNLNSEIVIQGNLDPLILFTDKDTIHKEVTKILDSTKGVASIFNLGHGILPLTPIDHVEFMIKTVREYNK